MPSISTVSGNTYSNFGPVTTTFTAPASCASDSNIIKIGPSNTGNSPSFKYALQCETFGGWECVPPVTIETSTTLETNPTVFFQAHYYSPGLYCPADWVTVGVASHDDKTLVTSGVLATTTRSTGIYLDRDRELFLSILDPSETAVLCCPRYVSILVHIPTKHERHHLQGLV